VDTLVASRRAVARRLSPPRVLLVGDYQPLLKPLKRGLEEEGFTVDVACRDRDGEAWIMTEDYNAIVLDVMRPEDAALSAVRRWRQVGLLAPVLVLTPSGCFGHPAGDLASDIDDWLTKPFHLDEFFARLQVLVLSDSAVACLPGVH
jgi:two-component system OmpR family response regulator